MSFNIIIPCYNAEKTLARTLDSLLLQKDFLSNIILIDDGGTDHTFDVAKQYIAQYPNLIQYHYQENKGPAAARNHGLQYAKGDYTLFLDADDTLSPDALQSFKQSFEHDSNLMLIIAGYASHHGDKIKNKIPKMLHNQGDILKSFWFGPLSLCGGAIAIRTCALTLARYPENIRHHEDVVFFSHLIASHKTEILPIVALHVFHHPDSLRHQSASLLKEGDTLIDLLFDQRFFPPTVMSLKNKYHAQKLLSLAKVYKKLDKKKEAREHIIKAITLYPPCLINPKILKVLLF